MGLPFVSHQETQGRLGAEVQEDLEEAKSARRVIPPRINRAWSEVASRACANVSRRMQRQRAFARHPNLDGTPPHRATVSSFYCDTTHRRPAMADLDHLLGSVEKRTGIKDKDRIYKALRRD